MRHRLGRLERLEQSGFSAVEAMVSLGVLSIAMVGFLGAMTAATKVSNEELAESDMQAETRKLTEELCRDLDSASICYIPPPGGNLGPAVSTTDTDTAGSSYMLLRYQFVVVGNDSNNPATFGQVNMPALSATIPYGATPPGANAAVTGACYTLQFKRDLRQQYVKEVDPATNPAPIPGTRYIYKDLDGDGAYTTTWVVGHVERRYTASFNSSSPAASSPADPIDKEYPNLVLLEWDAAGNSPKNTMFRWLEYPGSSTSVAATGVMSGYTDNCYHMFTKTTGDYMPISDPTYPSNAQDTTGNKQWDPILILSLRFLVQPDDGRLGNSATRMKIASTSIFMRSQSK